MTAFSFEPIGRIRSCFTQKFGIPRQPNLLPEARAVLEILPPYDRPEAFRGLDDFSHIWLIFVFHRCHQRSWKPTVRPPRLGGNRRIGVYASRSGFRPNAIGQSVVSLLGIEYENGVPSLLLGGIDLLDGTPVLDIKPYLPYSDSIQNARAGYAQTAPAQDFNIVFSPGAEAACQAFENADYVGLRALITGVLRQDPRPAYRQEDEDSFGMCLWDLNIRFRIAGETITVESIVPAPSP